MQRPSGTSASGRPVEAFWLQSSSGCAAGDSAVEALPGACHELIERVRLFDATTDLGVPTVIAVLTAPDGISAQPAVGAACAVTIDAAACKAIRELSIIRAFVWSQAADGYWPEIPATAFAHLHGVAGDGNPPIDLRGAGWDGNPPIDLRGVGGEAKPSVDLPDAPAEHRLARIVEILAAEGGTSPPSISRRWSSPGPACA